MLFHTAQNRRFALSAITLSALLSGCVAIREVGLGFEGSNEIARWKTNHGYFHTTDAVIIGREGCLDWLNSELAAEGLEDYRVVELGVGPLPNLTISGSSRIHVICIRFTIRDGSSESFILDVDTDIDEKTLSRRFYESDYPSADFRTRTALGRANDLKEILATAKSALVEKLHRL
jgi:hypothetical protein